MSRVVFSVLFVTLLQFSRFIYAQPYAGGRYQGTSPKDARITGSIVDNSNNHAVPYASVAIYRAKDSTLINGVMSTATGSFAIDNLPYGNFYLVINFVGYKKQKVSNIILHPGKRTLNVGAIKIAPTSTTIKEVEVLGSSSPIEYRIDKKVVDVSQNAAAAGGTVVDALQNTPSIQTDEQGNVTLRGSSNFTVLIDGKPSPISGSEALQQIPANMVQNVEIITNPSAKYDAEGSAGIINVVMKRQKIRGANGFLNLTAGTRDKYSGNLNVNYKHDKFNFSLGLNYTDMQFHAKFYQNSLYNIKDSLKSYTKNEIMNGNGSFERQGRDLTGGIDYYINDHNTLSLSGRFGKHAFKRDFTSNATDYFSNTNPDIYDINENSGTYKRNYYNLNLYYDLKLNDKGHEITLSSYITQGPEDNLSNINTIYTDSAWHSNGKYVNINSPQNSNETDWRTKLDYTLPIGDNTKFEAGYEGKYYEDLGNQGKYAYNDTTNTWVEDVSQRDKFVYKDQIHAGYLNFSNSNPIVKIMAGVRAEYEDRNFHQKLSHQTFIVNQLAFFPSVFISKDLPWKLHVQANYRRSIDRPHDWNLDPLKIETSPNNFRQGNPNLRPQMTNSFELNVEKNLTQGSFVSVEGFLRQTKDLIRHYDTTDFAGNKLSSFENIDHDQSMGLELMLNLSPVKWFTFNASSNIYNYKLFGINDSGVPNNINTWDLRINPSFSIPKGPSIQLSYSYNAPSLSGQGMRKGHYRNSIGIRQDLFKRKGSLTLQIRNLIGDEKYASTETTSSLSQYNYFQRESKVFMFTFSYRINNYKIERRKAQEMNGNGDQGGDMGF